MTDLLDLGGGNPWQTRASRVVFDNGSLRLLQDDVVQPDGAPGSYTYLELAWPVVAIVPLSDNGEVHLVRQWRYPWRRNSWEIPAGHGEPNEAPLASARRELAEEVGLHAETWEPLGTGFATASMNARYSLFLARGLSAAGPGQSRDGAEADMISRRLPLTEAIAAAMDGRIVHTLSVVGLLRTARLLGL